MRRLRFPRPDSPVLRLQVQPDKPGAIVAPRPRGSRRPHKDATVAAVRRLIEGTPLNYAEIAARTGVARASICRWTRDGGWKRHLFAPRATDTVPRERASARLKARTLAARLHALAERYVRELEETPGVDVAKLGEALELMKMAKLAARPKRRSASGGSRNANNVSAELRPAPLVPAKAGIQEPRVSEHVVLNLRFSGDEPEAECNAKRPRLNLPFPLAGEGDATPRAEGERLVAPDRECAESADPSPARAAVLEELRAAGVNLDRAPQAAVEDFIASRTPPRVPPRDDPALRQRGHRSKRNREHEWMLGRDDD